MSDYIETFKLPEPLDHAGIMKESDGFHPYVGGCGISNPVKNIELARKIIFDHIIVELEDRKEIKFKELEKIDVALKLLGKDPFRLGRFLIEEK